MLMNKSAPTPPSARTTELAIAARSSRSRSVSDSRVSTTLAPASRSSFPNSSPTRKLISASKYHLLSPSPRTRGEGRGEGPTETLLALHRRLHPIHRLHHMIRHEAFRLGLIRRPLRRIIADHRQVLEQIIMNHFRRPIVRQVNPPAFDLADQRNIQRRVVAFARQAHDGDIAAFLDVPL